jgi:hypothetical protein
MHSSLEAWRSLLLCAGLALAACTTPRDATPGCEAAASDAAAWRGSVERGPLYGTASRASRVAQCSLHQEPGVVELQYRFADGSRLRAKRDARIEYSEQELRLAAGAAVDAPSLLGQAERAAFGEAGCGIDWHRPETRSANDEPGATDAVFRGEVCNCQARVRRDAAGRVVGLALRSTC